MQKRIVSFLLTLYSANPGQQVADRWSKRNCCQSIAFSWLQFDGEILTNIEILRIQVGETAIANLTTEEVEEIFPAPVAADPPSRTGSRRPSKSSRKASKCELYQIKSFLRRHRALQEAEAGELQELIPSACLVNSLTLPSGELVYHGVSGLGCWPIGSAVISRNLRQWRTRAVDSGSEESESPGESPGTLSLQSAKRFLEKVKNACASDDFQQQLLDATARARKKSDTALLRMGIGALFISSCRHLLRKFGFPDTRQGYDQMFGAIFPHGQDPKVFELTRDIEKLLGVPPGSWFGINTEEDNLQDTPELSREEAKRLVTEVRRLVAAPNFQRELAELPESVDTPREQQVYMSVYQLLRPTLLSFGFRGDPQCLQRLQQTLTEHLADPKLRSVIFEVETQLLRVDAGSLLGIHGAVSSKDRAEMDTVKLRIRHAISHSEVRLTVSSEAAMGEILEALARSFIVGRWVDRAKCRCMKSIGKILVRPFGGKDGKGGKAEGKLSLSASAPTLKLNGAHGSAHGPKLGKIRPPREMPKWLEHELMQEKFAQEEHEIWRRDVASRLLQIREKPRLKLGENAEGSAGNEALNVLVYQLKRENLTEGQLFERIDSNQDGELSRSELQASLRKLGVSLSTSELDGILRIFDSDGSGSIDPWAFFEFSQVANHRYPLHSYQQGERVKLRLCMSNKALRFGEHDEVKSLHGTIVGPGPRKDTYLLKLEESDQNLLVKPRHLSKAKTASKASRAVVRTQTVELV
eukprot:s385_g14.t1